MISEKEKLYMGEFGYEKKNWSADERWRLSRT